LLLLALKPLGTRGAGDMVSLRLFEPAKPLPATPPPSAVGTALLTRFLKSVGTAAAATARCCAAKLSVDAVAEVLLATPGTLTPIDEPAGAAAAATAATAAGMLEVEDLRSFGVLLAAALGFFFEKREAFILSGVLSPPPSTRIASIEPVISIVSLATRLSSVNKFLLCVFLNAH
jgi:hypothetical protein